MAYTNLFNLGINMIDLELNFRGLGKGSKKFESLFAKDFQDLEKNYATSYQKATTAAQLLRQHIYSFEYEYAARYLTKRMNYTTRFDFHQPTPTITYELQIVKQQALALAASRYWKRQYKVESLDSYQVLSFMQLMGECWLKVGVQTMIYTVDSDNSQIEATLASINTTIVVTICISFVFAYGFAFTMYLVVHKVRGLYSIFTAISEEELDEMKGHLLGSIDLLDKCILGKINETENFNEIFLSIKVHDKQTKNVKSSGLPNQRKTTKQGRIKRGTLFTRCLGLLPLVVAVSALMQCFGTASLIIMQGEAQSASRLLVLMGLHRKLGTTTASLNYLNFRTYILALKIAGKGISFSSIADLKAEYRTVVKRYTDSLSDLESFLYTNQQSLETEKVGFETFIYSEPCSFFDTSRQLSSQECAGLADGAMDRRVIDVYRWQKIAVKNLVDDLESLTRDTALDYLNNHIFLELEYLRTYFNLPFFVAFSGQFYKKISNLEEKMANSGRQVIFSILASAIVLVLLLNLFGYYFIERQVFVSLQSLMLLPSSSYLRNPYVISKISKLKR